MQKQAIICTLLFTALLTGCGEQDTEPVIETPPLHEITTSVVWDNLTLSQITPVTSIVVSGDSLDIFPYNDNDMHITVKRILISDNDFWQTVFNTQDTENTMTCDEYSLITTSSGATYGYLEIDEESAYIAFTDSLPSSYVWSALEMLCNSGI